MLEQPKVLLLLFSIILATRPPCALSIPNVTILTSSQLPEGFTQDHTSAVPSPNINLTSQAIGELPSLHGTNLTPLFYIPWPGFPFSMYVLTVRLGPQFRHSDVRMVMFHFSDPGPLCNYGGQNFVYQAAHDIFLRDWPHNPSTTPFTLRNPDFEHIVGIAFGSTAALVDHDQRAHLWLLVQRAVGFLKRIYEYHGCRTSGVGLTAVWHDDNVMAMGAFRLDIRDPPMFDHNHHWPAPSMFPLRYRIPGADQPGTYLQFLDDDGAEGLWDGKVWTDYDPIRRLWVCGMLKDALNTIRHMEPDQHGHFNIDDFLFRARYVHFQVDITQNEESPDQARWTKDLAILIFTFLWHLVFRNGVIEVVIEVYKEHHPLGYITLQRLG